MSDLVMVRARGWATSRMILFSFALTVLGAVEQAGIVTLIPEQYQGVALMLIGVIVAVLRALTRLPLSSAPLQAQAKPVEASGGAP